MLSEFTPACPTNAVYGFIQMLRKLLRDEHPELIGVALDLGGSTLRAQKFEAYKANRAADPAESEKPIPLIAGRSRPTASPCSSCPARGGRRVSGTLALRAAGEGLDVVLVSADEILMRLIGPNVSMYHTGRNKLYWPAHEGACDYVLLIAIMIVQVDGGGIVDRCWRPVEKPPQ